MISGLKGPDSKVNMNVCRKSDIHRIKSTFGEHLIEVCIFRDIREVHRTAGCLDISPGIQRRQINLIRVPIAQCGYFYIR
ncbi:MAG: hypothetical protein DRP49_05170 [Spirochaetes bacterium]|nr:MAG: hypothetical protein DRP49_05170 [Spirochaetota bacterium]